MAAAQKILKINYEPLVNVICNYAGNCFRLSIFLRQKHRPEAYFVEGENRIFISPGAVDMAGIIITPLLDNYNRLDYNAIRGIYQGGITAGRHDGFNSEGTITELVKCFLTKK